MSDTCPDPQGCRADGVPEDCRWCAPAVEPEPCPYCAFPMDAPEISHAECAPAVEPAPCDCDDPNRCVACCPIVEPEQFHKLNASGKWCAPDCPACSDTAWKREHDRAPEPCWFSTCDRPALERSMYCLNHASAERGGAVKPEPVDVDERVAEIEREAYCLGPDCRCVSHTTTNDASQLYMFRSDELGHAWGTGVGFERARIKGIIEGALECDDPDHPCEPHADPCCGPCNWRPVILAAIDGGDDLTDVFPPED